MQYTKDKEGNYVYRETPHVSVKVIRHYIKNETYYSVYVEKMLYNSQEYIGSIRYTKHNLKTLRDAKAKGEELYAKILGDTI